MNGMQPCDLVLAADTVAILQRWEGAMQSYAQQTCWQLFVLKRASFQRLPARKSRERFPIRCILTHRQTIRLS